MSRRLLAVLFMIAGIAHFVAPDFFVAIVPPYLPAPELLVAASGVAELVLGAMLLVPAWSRVAAWLLIALLVAVFPANLYMAMNPHLFAPIPAALLWLRLPLQGALIAWTYRFTRPSPSPP